MFFVVIGLQGVMIYVLLFYHSSRIVFVIFSKAPHPVEAAGGKLISGVLTDPGDCLTIPFGSNEALTTFLKA